MKAWNNMVLDHLKTIIQSEVATKSSMGCFAGLESEPQLTTLISAFPQHHWFFPKVKSPKEKSNVAREMNFYPVSSEHDFEKGAFGIDEPKGNQPFHDRLDILFVPALAFDMTGARLGRGKGYYDTYLTKTPPQKTMGIAFSGQILENLPTEKHDKKVQSVCSERGVELFSDHSLGSQTQVQISRRLS